MLFRDLSVADAKSSAARGVDLLPRLGPGGFLKVEPPVRLRKRLARLPLLGDPVHLRRRSRLGRRAHPRKAPRPPPRLPASRCAGRCSRTAPPARFRHCRRAAPASLRPGYRRLPGHKLRRSSAPRRRPCRGCRAGIQGRRCRASRALLATVMPIAPRAGPHAVAGLDLDSGEALGQANDDALARRRRARSGWSRRRPAAPAPKDRARQEMRRDRATSAGRTSHCAGPPVRNQMKSASEPFASALPRKLRQIDHGGAHLLSLALRIPSARPAAHLVMSPAPRQITMSPRAAMSRSWRASCSRASTVHTERWPRCFSPSPALRHRRLRSGLRPPHRPAPP